MKNQFLFSFLFSFSCLLCLAQSNLPIYTTTLSKTSLPTGFTHSGSDADYSGPKLKYNTANDELLISFNSVPADITFDIGLNNNFSGSSSNITEFKVQEAISTGSFTDLATYGAGTTFVKGSKTITTVASTTRRLKFILTNKVSGTNVSLYNIVIASGGTGCTTPSSAGTITFTTTTNSSISGSITAGTGSTDGFLIFRSTSASPPSITNGTKYTSLNSPSGFSLVNDGPSASFLLLHYLLVHCIIFTSLRSMI